MGAQHLARGPDRLGAEIDAGDLPAGLGEGANVPAAAAARHEHGAWAEGAGKEGLELRRGAARVPWREIGLVTQVPEAGLGGVALRERRRGHARMVAANGYNFAPPIKSNESLFLPRAGPALDRGRRCRSRARRVLARPQDCRSR